MKPRKTPPTRGLAGIAMHGLFSVLFSVDKALLMGLCILVMAAVASSVVGMLLGFFQAVAGMP
jgi:Flp pilus assembly pilin Flp